MFALPSDQAWPARAGRTPTVENFRAIPAIPPFLALYWGNQ